MKKYMKILLILFIIIVSYIEMDHNDFMYKKEIMKINKIETIKEDYDRNDLGLTETIYIQKITGILLNGKNKNQEKTINYEYQKSEIVTEKYKVGDKVFISDNTIDGLKRDKYFVLLIMLLILLVYIIGKKRGLLTIISSLINLSIFIIGINLYQKGSSIIIITLIISIIFTVITLLSAAGYKKKTLVAVASTLLSTLTIFLLVGVIYITTHFKGINFNILSYLTVPPEEVFIASILIDGLGTITDVSITISSSIYELLGTNPKITNKELLESSKNIGNDIMPTMINVLFFTYFCSGLPTFVLAIRNGFSVTNYITTFYSLEITRFLCGSIGICITIPITTFIAIMVMRKEGKYE